MLFFDGVLTAREDYKRHQADARANSRPVNVLRNGQFVTVPSREVVVGDVVRISRGEDFPADLIFLVAGGEDTWQRSVCVRNAAVSGGLCW